MAAEAIEFLDRFSTFKLYQLNAIAHFDPGDAKASDQKTNGMAVVHVSDERVAKASIGSAAVAARSNALIFQALGEGLEGKHQILD